MPGPISIVAKIADIVKSTVHSLDGEYLFEDILAYLSASLPHLISLTRRTDISVIDPFWDEIAADLWQLMPRKGLSREHLIERTHLVSGLIQYCRFMNYHYFSVDETSFQRFLDIADYGNRPSFYAHWSQDDPFAKALGEHMRSLSGQGAHTMAVAG